MTTLPLHDRAEAVDSCLEARKALADVRDSTIAGTALYLAADRAIQHTDKAIRELRK